MNRIQETKPSSQKVAGAVPATSIVITITMIKRAYYLIILNLVFVLTSKGQTDSAFSYQKPLFDFDYAKPAFKLKNELQSNRNRFLRYGVLTCYREGVKPIQNLEQFNTNFQRYNDPLAGTARIAMYNLSIVEMLYHFPVDPSKVVLEVKDPSKYMYDPKYGSKEAWSRKNTYCYEYLVPAAFMQIEPIDEDLERIFGIRVSREKRMATAEERYGLDPKLGNKQVNVFVIREINK